MVNYEKINGLRNCHDYQRQLRDFFRLTGEVPLIPKYALGNWWSRYRAYTQEEYLDLTRPLIHVDGQLGKDSILPVPTKPLNDIYVTVINNKINELKEKEKSMVQARKEVMERRIEEERRIFLNFQQSSRDFTNQETEREEKQANNAMMTVAKIFDLNQSRLRQTLSANNEERRDTAE